MPILTRYLVREGAVAFFAVTAVLMLIMLANLLAKALGMAADGSLPARLVPLLVGFNAVKLLIYVLPVGLFIGLMFALGRMNRDSELSVLRSCGFGHYRMMQAVMVVALPVSLLASYISLSGWPQLKVLREHMVDQARTEQLVNRLPVGRFVENAEGNIVVYVGERNRRTGQYQNLFVYDERGKTPGVEMAPSGGLFTDAGGNRYLQLNDGRRIQGVAGQGNWSVVDYQHHDVLIPGMAAAPGERETAASSWELMRSDRAADRAEFFYRLSQGISAFILALIAVPLAQSRPRSGRYGRLFWAFLLYALYFNVITVIDSAIGHGHLSLWEGLAVTHGAFILLLMLMLWAARGGWRRMRYRSRKRREARAA